MHWLAAWLLAALCAGVAAPSAVAQTAARQPPVFYISGYIRNPGQYVLRGGTTVGDAIEQAGGIAARGSDEGILVIRAVDGSTPIQLKVTLDDKVQPDDEIKIPKPDPACVSGC